MKFFFTLIIISFFLPNNVFAKKYKVDDIVENKFYFSKNYIIDLPKGKWIVAEKNAWANYGLSLLTFTLLKTEKNNAVEAISIGEFRTAGVVENVVNHALKEIMFKNKYDGCYDRPEYTILEFYLKGNTHNCFMVRHSDLMKDLFNPDDPELIGSNAQLKKWLRENNIVLPKVALYSSHSYFSRLKGGKWYVLDYAIDPLSLGATKNKFISENNSEYHRNNIENFPEYKKIMDKWISISSQRHANFENSVNALKRHKLNLNDLLETEKVVTNVDSEAIVQNLEKLKDLYENGVLSKEEFDKAKKKILN